MKTPTRYLAKSLLILLAASTSHAGFCGAFLGSIKYKLGIGVQAHAPQRFSENSEHAKELMATANSIRTKVLVDADLPSPELVPLAKELMGIATNARPFSVLPDELGMQFGKFSLEALHVIDEGKVSLNWLTSFSYRLSFLLTKDPFGSSFDLQRTQIDKSGVWKSLGAWNSKDQTNSPPGKLVQRFLLEDVLALPVTKNLGIFEINRLVVSGIAPIRQRSKSVTFDGFERYADESWDRDYLKANSMLRTKDFRDYGTKLLQKAETLSKKERSQVEMMFYFLSYEQPWLLLGSRVTKLEFQRRFLGDILSNDAHSIFSVATSTDGFAPLLISAGVDINNPKQVRRWVSEAMDQFALVIQELR